MAWSVEFLRTAERQLERIDRTWQRRILDYLDDQVAVLDDPRQRGKSLASPLAGLWRYRVGDYRIVCEIVDAEQLIRVIKIGHRRSIYR